MYKIGDIIVVDKFKDERGNDVSKHSFIVLDNKNYLISNMMCSFHNKKQKKRKIDYYGNIEVKNKKLKGNLNDRSGYIKIDKLYYFDKNKNYEIIGHIGSNYLSEIYLRIIRLTSQRRIKLVATNI